MKKTNIENLEKKGMKIQEIFQNLLKMRIEIEQKC